MRPKVEVSVLMSVHNGEKWLKESIESILNQSYEDFEFIIINDGSTDSTVDVLKKYSQSDNRIRFFSKSNTGLTDSLNFGLSKCSGSWIARIDADDVSNFKRLEKQLRFVKMHNLVFVGSYNNLINIRGETIDSYTYPTKHKDLVNNLEKVRSFMPHSSAFFSLQSALKVGGYRQRIKRGQDWDLWLRLIHEGEISCVDEYLVECRYHKDQITNQNFGLNQLVDSRVSITSYWIKMLSKEDIIESEEDKFNQFHSWVREQLENAKFLEYKRFISKYKSLYFNSDDLFSAFHLLLMGILNLNFLLRYANERIVGEKICKHLAKSWIKKVP